MTTTTELLSQEFTLPFVGREEELQFLLDEYDEMLHAQYRSVWIEAPAGVGKTTLVEEFLRRIDVAHPATAGCATSGLQPWIVHAHLRERSSNSLASFVEALGATLQTLTQTQQKKLFSGLTSFYQERARRIVGSGNVQSMDMEEAITTAGYILKQLSKYYPLVVIIEDIHVLKGEPSFYALRHLLAIIEHVPMLAIFISRPSEEKNIKQFQEQVIKEGCKKYEVGGLKEEDVKKLVETSRAPGRLPNEDVKKLMRLSGGNALLLRELMRNENIASINPTNSTNSASESIAYYLTKELEKLPKNDRQVIAIAGMLGEEFSEQLLEDMARAKDYNCWSKDVVSRLEHHGILKRRRKELIPEGAKEGEKAIIKVSVFSHALWWESARKLYHQEKKDNNWTDKNFAEAIVPLLSHQDYPLLTDAELIVNLLQWLKRENALPLVRYVHSFTGMQSRWSFHSSEELATILDKTKQCILDLRSASGYTMEKEDMWMFIGMLNTEQIISRLRGGALHVVDNNYVLMRELLTNFLDDDSIVMKEAAIISFNEGLTHFLQYGNEKPLDNTERFLKSVKRKATQDQKIQNLIAGLEKGIEACRMWFRDPERSAELFNSGVKKIGLRDDDLQNMVAGFLMYIVYLPTCPQSAITQALLSIDQLRNSALEIYHSNLTTHALNFRLIYIYRTEIELSLRSADFQRARKLAEELQETAAHVLSVNERITAKYTLANYYGYVVDTEAYLKIFHEIFDDKFSSVDEERRFKAVASSLFYAEQWDEYEKYWKNYGTSLFNFNIPTILPLMEGWMNRCFLRGDGAEVEDAISQAKNIVKKYPMMEPSIRKILHRAEIFSSLRKKTLSDTKKKFRFYIKNANDLSMFDRAHQAQLFAQVGVKNGHAPKEFSWHVEYALKNFVKLGLGKRVVFTAEKLAGANLISQKRIEQIRKKYQTVEFETPRTKKEIRATSPESRVTSDEEGIIFQCLGTVKAIGPNGEIQSRQWGKQKMIPSHQKRIIVELVCAEMERQPRTKEQLLRALYPELRKTRISRKEEMQYEKRLAVYLSQIKVMFAPHQVFQKTSEGYRLHRSVKVDLVEAIESMNKAEMLSKVHIPSSLWLYAKSLARLKNNVFALGMRGRQIMLVRKKTEEECKKCELLMKRLEKNVALM